MRSNSFATVALIALVLLWSASGSSLSASTAVSSGFGQATPVLSTASSSSATVAGTIRHNGSPVSDVQVLVLWEGGEQSVTTGADGRYGASGIPTGGPVSVHVRPPVEQRLAFRNWRTEALSGDLVKDFDLGLGRRLQGEVRTPDGTPYPRAPSFRARTLDFSLPEGEWLEVAAGEAGGFDVVLPPGFHRLYQLAATKERYSLPSTTVDLRTDDVTAWIITLQFGAAQPVTPPDASRITVSDPDMDGYATVIGASGAVEPLSDVAVINLSARTMMRDTAGVDGAFSATLYAPPGSSLLIKYEISGDLVEWFWQHAEDGVADAALENLNPLPGTILHVGELPGGGGSSQAFSTVGAFIGGEPKGWAGWWLSGTLQVPPGGPGPGLAVQPGQQVTLNARLRVTSPALSCTGTPTVTAQTSIDLRHLFGPDGRADPWGVWFTAHLFTPTGLPIEHEAGGEVRTIGSESFASFACVSEHAVDGFLATTFTIPASLPDGIYLPRLFPGSNVPLADDVPQVLVWYQAEPIAYLPPLTVGSPEAPSIPWTLLGDYPVNGHRGLQAREDVGYFAMPTRVLLPPHKVVIPRLDERSGAPLVYRVEPGSHWLSASDRRLPNPPHIPLSLPSGHLMVEVLKPDGSVDLLGPSPILQSSVRTPTVPGGSDLDERTGNICDLYHLTTMDGAFDYSFDQYGPHTIFVMGEVSDVYGNTYPIHATYDVTVARVLDLDPAQLPTTPYQQGDAFAPGLHVFPPVPAEVQLLVTQMPYSDPALAVTTTITGHANRFGYFQPPVGTEIRLEAPGEFRVDITAEYEAPDGTLWAGTVTWGNVVEGPNAMIEAHGRRGPDYVSDKIDDMPAWFELHNLPPDKLQGSFEVYYPYFSGDVHWGNGDRAPGDSIHPIITVKDRTGGSETIYEVLRNHFARARNCFRWPPMLCTPAGLNARIAVGEAPLFITTRSGVDPGVDPEDIDLLSYSYASSERPDVHVREVIGEDGMGTTYWGFQDTYGYQIGEPADGDQPGDLKWEFGGAVFRTITETAPLNEYAIYSSLWVLLPDGDAVGARVTPPFRGAGALNGGPIMALLGEDIDMLFLPKGVRPGDVLHLGDAVAFSGHVGPPLDSQVSVTITSPTGVPRSRTWHANKIGWLYDPSFDFVADEPGRWTVDVAVLHDRPYLPTGITPTEHNTGTVLGTNGQYEFYVVEPDGQWLVVTAPQAGFISWPSNEVEPIHIRGIAPAGTSSVYYTIHDKGVVMGQGSVPPDASGAFTVTYDAVALHDDFSMLSLTAHEGRWEGLADEVAINLLAVGPSSPLANSVTLIGEEVFVAGKTAGYHVYLPIVLKDH